MLKSKRLVVLHDELGFKIGVCKGSFGGSAKGHNGVRSLHGLLKTEDFHRFKIGIDRPPGGLDAARWCLSPAMHEELRLVEEGGAITASAWQYLLEQGLVLS